MMAGFLAIPEKRTGSVSLQDKLGDIFAPSVDETVCNNFRDSLKKLDGLRSDAISGHQRLASGLSLEEALSRYIDQLNYLEEAIPKQHLQVPFTWKNAFSNGTIITFYTLFTQSTISFEKICLFFNLAAYLSQHAAGKGNPNEEEGLRNAAKLFQRSAGIFQYIRHASSVSTVEGVTTDLHIGTLQALENLCLAQAQECFYLKALQDNKASSVLARLAQRATELYETAWKHMKKEHPCSYQWAYVMQFKEAAFRGATQFHQADQDGKDCRVSDELARLDLAMAAFRAASKQAENITIVVLGSHWREMYKNAQITHKRRRYENECVYKEKVTSTQELPAVDGAALAKAIPPVLPLTLQENLFVNLPQEFRALVEVTALPAD
ncbi:apoptosis-linked gene 2-interacting protein X 1-like isoform X2 [Varroa jacobsoni]|uniref:BRO1 domain-containing protein n=2 Tax=Varroa TaxID=62624 RepID=A0A7M7JR10_VARDE|nr:apoptosis-linked gene 2-interacting protein X 1-like isoform X1 [Varroa destructor]XP_022654921.1 apoptosis-linked gene 2-interacting protein X 1-like isoform X1 [Varroa destructor]XP_022654922.1 apoptosis-linked gene 2-interacting protein X 1-like isoform X1 [Varroa destructor]XP_022654923.1 apoptosis-linked gene 2-interacting protein X 1-like isoform X1 [Varroa destructor]XP_022654924.1 apoptosis-linked gene 2-interacting protein X 1-like isoform X1 [Varroa destructor]XP_022654925.1 apopt